MHSVILLESSKHATWPGNDSPDIITSEKQIQGIKVQYFVHAIRCEAPLRNAIVSVRNMFEYLNAVSELSLLGKTIEWFKSMFDFPEQLFPLAQSSDRSCEKLWTVLMRRLSIDFIFLYLMCHVSDTYEYTRNTQEAIFFKDNRLQGLWKFVFVICAEWAHIPPLHAKVGNAVELQWNSCDSKEFDRFLFV